MREPDCGTVIEADAVTKAYGDRFAVRDVSFTLVPGKVYGLLGANGAGKSTLLRMLTGLITPTSGTALIGDLPLRRHRPPVRDVAAHLDTRAVNPSWTGRRDLSMAARAVEVPASRVEEVADQTGLRPVLDRACGTYSLGNLQRLGLARVMVGNPKVVLLDEPTTGLDAQGLAWLRSWVRGLVEGGGTVLLSSHAFKEVQDIADEILVMAHGRLIHQGSSASLLESSGAEVIVASPEPERLRQVLLAEGLAVDLLEGSTMRVCGVNAGTVGVLARDHGVALTQLRDVEHDLEDVFVRLTAEQAA
jgi:ABC-2 type transport system ATP-binding protein